MFTPTSSDALIPGFTGLVLRKFYCNLGLDPNTFTTMALLFDILIHAIDHIPFDRPVWWPNLTKVVANL